MTKSKLKPFEGTDVSEATIKVTNAGDGLSKALEVEPEAYHEGDRIYVVLETKVAKVTFEPIPDNGTLRRVHTLRAGAGTVVDGELVRDMIQAQKAKIAEAQGVHELDLDGEKEGDEG